jgi:hypothetical protein
VRPRSIRRFAAVIKTSVEGASEQAPSPLDLLNPDLVLGAVLDILRELLAHEKVTQKSCERDIATISPYPPLKSGISDYSQKTLTGRPFVKINSEADKDLEEIFQWSWIKIAQLKRIFVLGNNHNFHSSAAYAAIKLGGSVILHDTRLKDFWNHLFGHNAKKFLESFSNVDDEPKSKLPATQNSEDFNPFVKTSNKIFVHSKALGKKLEIAGAKQVTVLPYASSPQTSESVNPSDRNASETFRLGVFGITDCRTKLFDRILSSVEDVARSGYKIKLVVVGELLNDAEKCLADAPSFVKNIVEPKGRVSEQEYWKLLRGVNATIHIRREGKLSLSGALIDSIDAETPVLVSENLATDMDIPEEASLICNLDPTVIELSTKIKNMIANPLSVDNSIWINFNARHSISSYQELLLAAID